MARRLRYTVYIDDGGEGGVRSYGPDSTFIPAKDAELITNPKVWIDDDSAPEAALAAAEKSGPLPSADGVGTVSAMERPPAGGPGSGTESWIAYARSLGIEVDDATPRGDVIEKVEAQEAAIAAAAGN